MENEATPLIRAPDSNIPVVTKYRWVILAIFSMFSFLQSSVWDTWGPISPSATEAIGFTAHDYDLLSNWAPIGIMTTMPFFIWLMNKKGTRWPVIVGGALVAVGTGLRCLPLSGISQKITIHIGQLLNAMAGCPVLGAAPLLSNTWFPPNQRILATSCMLCLGNVGNALSFLIGPAVVESPNNCTRDSNVSTTTPSSLMMTEAVTTSVVTTACSDNTEEIRKQISYYMYGEFVVAVIILLLILLFFRNKPPSPPSVSAATERLDILAGLKALSRKYSYWAFIISFSLVEGAYYGWYGIVTVLLKPHGVSEAEVGKAAFTMTLVGTAAGILVGWFADHVKGHVKWILFACYCTMFVVFLYLVMMIMSWLKVPFSDSGFWASFIILGTVSSVIQPLGMEKAADIAYPVSEGTSTSIVAWFIMLCMFIFLLILNAVTNQDIANYLFLVFCGLAAPILVVSTKNQNVRLAVDRNIQERVDATKPSEANDEPK